MRMYTCHHCIILCGLNLCMYYYLYLTQVELVEEGPPRKLRVEYKDTANNEVASEEFNTVLIAVGRDPCTSGIGLDKAGVIVDEKFVFCNPLLCCVVNIMCGTILIITITLYNGMGFV